MDKRLTLTVLLFVVAGTLGLTGLVWAEGDPPSGPQLGVPNTGCGPAGNSTRHGPGMMGTQFGRQGQGMMSGAVCAAGSPMHAAMQAALAEGLGLTPEDFGSRLEAGQTPAQIATDLGLSRETFLEIMDAAHEAAWENMGRPAFQAQTGWRMGWMGHQRAQPMDPQRGPMQGDCPCIGD